MKPNKLSNIIITPWDQRALGIPTYEIKEMTKKSIESVENIKGFFTLKVDPLADKEILINHSFYYVDTLAEPCCYVDNFVYYDHDDIEISNVNNKNVEIGQLYSIVKDSFIHGRFHKDPYIPNYLADLRYQKWIDDLYKSNQIFLLLYKKKLAGFFAYQNNKIVLHALRKEIRGYGLSKYFWSLCIQKLFNKGYKEVISSISLANLPVLNLYISLGFKIRNVLDIYHKLTIELDG